jgi:hypothetical protein
MIHQLRRTMLLLSSAMLLAMSRSEAAGYDNGSPQLTTLESNCRRMVEGGIRNAFHLANPNYWQQPEDKIQTQISDQMSKCMSSGNPWGEFYWQFQSDMNALTESLKQSLVQTQVDTKRSDCTEGVKNLYRNILYREAEQGGLDAWTNYCVSLNMPVPNILASFDGGFRGSAEGLARKKDADFVQEVYQRHLGRAASVDEVKFQVPHLATWMPYNVFDDSVRNSGEAAARRAL